MDSTLEELVRSWVDYKGYNMQEMSTDEITEIVEEFFNDLKECYSYDVFHLMEELI